MPSNVSQAVPVNPTLTSRLDNMTTSVVSMEQLVDSIEEVLGVVTSDVKSAQGQANSLLSQKTIANTSQSLEYRLLSLDMRLRRVVEGL